MNLIGKLESFEGCSLAILKQKCQKSRNQQVKGSRRKDISLIKSESFGKSKYWLLGLIEDQYTNMRLSFFLSKRTEISEKVVNLIKELRVAEKNVKLIRMDSAEEDTRLS